MLNDGGTRGPIAILRSFEVSIHRSLSTVKLRNTAEQLYRPPQLSLASVLARAVCLIKCLSTWDHPNPCLSKPGTKVPGDLHSQFQELINGWFIPHETDPSGELQNDWIGFPSTAASIEHVTMKSYEIPIPTCCSGG